MTSHLRANVLPREVLFSSSEILIDSDYPLDDRSAQDGILVQGQRGEVSLNKDGTQAIWSPLSPLPMGSHTLTVGNLLTQSGEDVLGSLEIPFFMTDSKAEVSKDLAVQSMVRLAVEELGTRRLSAEKRPEGDFIEVMKASDRTTGEPKALGFDQDGKAIDTDEIFATIRTARANKYGKIHPSLYNRLEADGEGPVKTAIWLLSPKGTYKRPVTQQDGPLKTPPEVIEDRRQIQEVTRRFVDSLTARGVEARADRLAPVVYATLTAEQIRELTDDAEVCAIFLHQTEGFEDLQDSIEIAGTDHVHSQGFRGTGINVAVWEQGPDDLSDLDISDSFDPMGATSRHARLTHAIIKNVETGAPHGHAPDCELHSANDFDVDALTWAAEENCTVMSQSFHRSDEPHSDTLTFDDVFKDLMALQWPYPTIVQAAGNFWNTDPDNVVPPSDEFVNHKGYNSLSIGNHDDEADAMVGTSVFRNPVTPHGDRELPELAANGFQVRAVGVPLANTTGTSFATPAVAGSAALIQEVNATLRNWPEGCRAILLAGAGRNVADGTWWNDVQDGVDAADGSGALDTRENVEIAKIRRFPGAAATQRGWDIGNLESSNFDGAGWSTSVYRARVPSGVPLPWRVKVALAWTSKLGIYVTSFPPTFDLVSELAVDLDLTVWNSKGQLVAYSGSWDNSYEIAEFRGVPGETYTIKIRRWSGTDDTTFGIAWTMRPAAIKQPPVAGVFG